MLSRPSSAQRRRAARLLRIVGEVEALDAVDALGAEPVDRAEHLLGRLRCPRTGAPTRQPRRRHGSRRSPRHRRCLPLPERRAPVDQVGLEERAKLPQPLGSQPLAVGRVRTHGVGDVGRPIGLPSAPRRGQRGVVELEAELAQGRRPSRRRAAPDRRGSAANRSSSTGSRSSIR